MPGLPWLARVRHADGAGLVPCDRGHRVGSRRVERLGVAGTGLGLDDGCKHWWPFLAQRITSRVGASASWAGQQTGYRSILRGCWVVRAGWFGCRTGERRHFCPASLRIWTPGSKDAPGAVLLYMWSNSRRHAQKDRLEGRRQNAREAVSTHPERVLVLVRRGAVPGEHAWSTRPGAASCCRLRAPLRCDLRPPPTWPQDYWTPGSRSTPALGRPPNARGGGRHRHNGCRFNQTMTRVFDRRTLAATRRRGHLS